MAKSKRLKKNEGGYFRQAKDYTRASKNYIYLAVILFVVFMILSLFLPVPLLISSQINEMLKHLAEQVTHFNPLEMIFFIFKNNLSVSLLGILLGVLFGIIPVVLAISNGYVLGYVIKLVVLKLGFLQGVVSLWKLFPHGIFEIPAVLISLGLGIKLGKIFLFSLNKNSFKDFNENLILAFKVFIFIILPLLLIAAVIEGSLMFLMG